MSSIRAEKPWSNSGSFLFEAVEDLGVVVPAAVVDRHEAHAALDQPPGQQAALAERRCGRSGRAAGRSPARWRRRRGPRSTGSSSPPAGGTRRRWRSGRCPGPAWPGRPRRRAGSCRRAVRVRRHRLGGADVLHLEVGLVGVAGLERLVAAAEVGALAQLPGERRVARNGDVGRQLAAEAQSRGRPRRRSPGSRRTPSRSGRTAPSWSPSRGGRCCARRSGPGRPCPSTCAMQRQHLADLQAGHAGVDRLVLAADLGRGVGLGVEAVVVRQAAAEVDQDHRLARLRLCRSPARASPRSRAGSVRPRPPRAPTRRKSRRDTPSQRRDARPRMTSSMTMPPASDPVSRDPQGSRAALAYAVAASIND